MLGRIAGFGAAFLWLLSTGAVAETPAPPPIEAFGDLPFAAQPALSPDGKHLALIQNLHGRPAVVIYTLDAPRGSTPKIVADPDALIVDASWAKNDRLLITINANMKADGDTKIQSWFRTMSVDADGANSAMMFGNSTWRDYNYSAASVADFDLDDAGHVYMPLFVPGLDDGLQLDLYRVDVKTGDAERARSGNRQTNEWIMDGHGHVVARVDQTEHPLVDHLKFLANDDWKEIGTYEATGGQGAGVEGLSEDGSALVQFGTNEATGTRGLTRLDSTTAKQSTLYSNAQFDADSSLTDGWTGRVIGVAFADDHMEYRYFDPSMQALQRGLEVAFPGLSAHAVSWDTAKDRLIVSVEGPRQPQSFYYLDRATHEATKISSSYPSLVKPIWAR